MIRAQNGESPNQKYTAYKRGKHRPYTEPSPFQHREKLKIGGKGVFKMRGCSDQKMCSILNHIFMTFGLFDLANF